MKRIVTSLAACLFLAGTAAAQSKPIIYPQKGQSKQQQEKDEFECYKWAKEQTGFDPMAPPPAVDTSQRAPQGGAVQGAAKGAALGAIGGAIAGDAGKGAAVGAGVGGAAGAMKKRGSQREQQQAQQQAQAGASQQRATYDRAVGACMEGRGYTVK